MRKNVHPRFYFTIFFFFCFATLFLYRMNDAPWKKQKNLNENRMRDRYDTIQCTEKNNTYSFHHYRHDSIEFLVNALMIQFTVSIFFSVFSSFFLQFYCVGNRIHAHIIIMVSHTTRLKFHFLFHCCCCLVFSY